MSWDQCVQGQNGSRPSGEGVFRGNAKCEQSKMVTRAWHSTRERDKRDERGAANDCTCTSKSKIGCVTIAD